MNSKTSALCALILYALCLVIVGHLACSRWPPTVQTKEEIEALPASQPDLRGIGIGDLELQLIAERFHALNYLYLNSQSRISDLGISALSKSSKLYQLVIEDGRNLTDKSIVTLANLPSIRQLIITNGSHLTDASLTILGGNSNFELVYFIDCPMLSPSAKDKFIAAHPKCKTRF